MLAAAHPASLLARAYRHGRRSGAARGGHGISALKRSVPKRAVGAIFERHGFPRILPPVVLALASRYIRYERQKRRAEDYHREKTRRTAVVEADKHGPDHN